MKKSYRNILIPYVLPILLALFLTQCEKDAPEMVNEEELITTVTLTLNAPNETTQNIRWKEGGSSPEINLKANVAYSVEIAFLDESDPADVEDITQEVKEEADEHLVFYDNNISGLTIDAAGNDIKDTNGVATGIHTQWKTQVSGEGTLRVYLIHEPTSKTAETRAAIGGETDVEVDFLVKIND